MNDSWRKELARALWEAGSDTTRIAASHGLRYAADGAAGVPSAPDMIRYTANGGYSPTMEYFAFPPPSDDASCGGLLGFTANITPQMVLSAYLQGVFPWYGEDDPVAWWRAEPRFVLPIDKLHVGERMERTVRTAPFTYKMDSNFRLVMEKCAEQKRAGQCGTWIVDGMIECYCELARRGIAHSVEAWHDGNLAGGFYGVLIGSVFCGESMFTAESNSSKCAFVTFARAFARCGGGLIDSQTYTANMARYGAYNISTAAFMRMEEELLRRPLTGDLKQEVEGMGSGEKRQAAS